MGTLEASKSVVLDASVLINFLILDRLDLLGALGGYRFVVPEEVEAEVMRVEQVVRLRKGIDGGYAVVESTIDLAEIESSAALRLIMGKGEAAALAMAEHRGWLVACDERGCFFREARQRLGSGRILNTPGLLLLAIRSGLLGIGEADQMKGDLEKCRFKMRFGSFAEVV